jgi:twitching motility two-component system response regulator PilH
MTAHFCASHQDCFRRENINVITCADAASALAQFEQNRPDVVITDVIMPNQDGYAVCSQIKQHPEFGGIPVVLMSGVVNKSVADKAVAVHADELIRKPFQPQELIGRVRTLLAPKETPAQQAARGGQPMRRRICRAAGSCPARCQSARISSVSEITGELAWLRVLAEAFHHCSPGWWRVSGAETGKAASTRQHATTIEHKQISNL